MSYNRVVQRMESEFMSEKKKLAMIVHSGTLDKLYCAFILGSTATTMGWEAHLYFTFWGLQALVKGAMEKAGLPSDYKQMEKTMAERLKKMKYPTPYELLKRMKTSGLLTIYACTPTMEMFGIKKRTTDPRGRSNGWCHDIPERSGRRRRNSPSLIPRAESKEIQLFISLFF